MTVHLNPYLKGLVTKAKNNQDGGISLRTLRSKIVAFGVPAQQAKHAARKLVRG